MDPLFNKKEYLGKQTQPLPTERYLIEITYPKVYLAYKDQLITKSLVENDIDVLIRAGFRGWMPYMMNTHFRMELNLTSSVPMPKVFNWIKALDANQNANFEKFDLEIKEAIDHP